MLENKHTRKVAFHSSVNHMGIDKTDYSQLYYDSDGDSIPSLNNRDGQCTSSDESSDDESSSNGSEVFEFDEPAVNKQTI